MAAIQSAKPEDFKRVPHVLEQGDGAVRKSKFNRLKQVLRVGGGEGNKKAYSEAGFQKFKDQDLN